MSILECNITGVTINDFLWQLKNHIDGERIVQAYNFTDGPLPKIIGKYNQEYLSSTNARLSVPIKIQGDDSDYNLVFEVCQ